jgi:hypothetical protein
MHCLAPNCSGDGTGCDNMTCIITTFKPYKSNILTNANNSVNSIESIETTNKTDKIISNKKRPLENGSQAEDEDVEGKKEEELTKNEASDSDNIAKKLKLNSESGSDIIV